MFAAVGKGQRWCRCLPRASTGSAGVAAQAAPPPPCTQHSPVFPPPRLSSPWWRDCVWLSPLQRRSGRCETSDFVLSSRGWGVCGEVAEVVSMSSLRLNGQRWRCGVSSPSPPSPLRARHSPVFPPLHLLFPLGPDHFFVPVAEDEWQMCGI